MEELIEKIAMLVNLVYDEGLVSISDLEIISILISFAVVLG